MPESHETIAQKQPLEMSIGSNGEALIIVRGEVLQTNMQFFQHNMLRVMSDGGAESIHLDFGQASGDLDALTDWVHRELAGKKTIASEKLPTPALAIADEVEQAA